MPSLIKSLKFLGITLTGATALLWAMDHFQNKIPEELRGAADLERATFDSIIAQLIAGMDKNYGGKEGLFRRDVHVKFHSCLKATFKVADNIPDNLKVGMFANEGAEHKTWVRLSNGSFKPSNDAAFDGRGFAIKILDTPPDEPASPSKPVDQFDMLLVNHTVFFSPDPLDYYDFVKSGILKGVPGALNAYFMPNYNPFSWRIRQFFIAFTNSSKEIATPLDLRYFSMVPFAFGDDQQIKYSARQCKGTPKVAVDVDHDNPNYLRANLKKHFDEAPSCFSLAVQVNDGSGLIEDATAEWRESRMPFHEIGRITIPKQSFANPHNDYFCEHSDFNPARTPEAFKGLGAINRLREEVYTTISDYRHKKNNIPAPDPNLAWDQNSTSQGRFEPSD